MLKSAALVALSALVLGIAQSDNTTTTSGGTAGTNFTIDVSGIAATTKASWCQGQQNSCGQLCGESPPKENTCDVTTLDYTCTCQNNSAPGLQYYTQTMYTFVCEQAFTDCIEETVGNAQGQAACTRNIKDNCGKLNPAEADVSDNGNDSSNSSDSTSATPSGTTASASATSAPATGAAALHRITVLGNAAALVAAVVFAAVLW